MNFAKFVRTHFLQNTNRRLLLIIAVSIVLVMKEELTSETELTIFVKTTPSQMFDWIESRLKAKGFKY